MPPPDLLDALFDTTPPVPQPQPPQPAPGDELDSLFAVPAARQAPRAVVTSAPSPADDGQPGMRSFDPREAALANRASAREDAAQEGIGQYLLTAGGQAWNRAVGAVPVVGPIVAGIPEGIGSGIRDVAQIPAAIGNWMGAPGAAEAEHSMAADSQRAEDLARATDLDPVRNAIGRGVGRIGTAVALTAPAGAGGGIASALNLSERAAPAIATAVGVGQGAAFSAEGATRRADDAGLTGGDRAGYIAESAAAGGVPALFLAPLGSVLALGPQAVPSVGRAIAQASGGMVGVSEATSLAQEFLDQQLPENAHRTLGEALGAWASGLGERLPVEALAGAAGGAAHAHEAPAAGEPPVGAAEGEQVIRDWLAQTTPEEPAHVAPVPPSAVEPPGGPAEPRADLGAGQARPPEPPSGEPGPAPVADPAPAADGLAGALAERQPAADARGVAPIPRQRVGADEPPLAEGHVRLYHGGVHAPDGQPRWFIADRAYAEGYARKSGEHGDVAFVDLPHDHPEVRDRLRHMDGSPTGATVAVELPGELADQRRVLAKQTPKSEPGAEPSLAEVVGAGESPLRAPEPLPPRSDAGFVKRGADPALRDQQSLPLEEPAPAVNDRSLTDRPPSPAESGQTTTSATRGPKAHHDIIDQVIERGGIATKPRRGATPEYEGAPRLTGKARRSMGGTEAPDQMAKALHDDGVGDGSVNTMWRLMDEAQRQRQRTAVEPDKASDSLPPEQTAHEPPRELSPEDQRIAEEVDAHAFEVLGHGAKPPPRTTKGAAEGPPEPKGPKGPAPAGRNGVIARQLWGGHSFIGSDVVPKAADAAKGLVDAARDMRGLLAPQTAGAQAKMAAGMAREHGADLAQRSDRARESLRKARGWFESQGKDDNLAFIDRMESGKDQPTGPLKMFAAAMREVLDTKRKEIQALGTGKLEHFIEDYFPHIWKDPEAAAATFSRVLGKRPLEGPKSFLKKRSIPTVRDGIEAGLEPASDNPVDLVLLKAREMDRYLLGQRMLGELKDNHLAKYVSVNDAAPEGYGKIDDKIAQVYGPRTVSVSEHVDKAVYEPLRQVLDNLGIKHERKASTGRGNLGLSYQGKSEIATRGGTELGVIAHELGHQLDHKFGLGRIINGQELKSETAALADLHAMKSEEKQAYFRTPEERTASALEAYVQAKDRMREVAPKTLAALERFIGEHEELAPLATIKPSLEYQKLEYEKAHGGLLKMGEYFAPQAVADVLNNYLSPGLRRKAWFRAWLGAAGFLNSAQLGFSAFHLGFTSLDAATSKLAIGLKYAVHGSPLKALRHLAEIPIAPVTNAFAGSRVLREWMRPGSEGAETAQIVDAMKAAGGRGKMDSLYELGAADAMVHAFRKGNVLGGLFRIPGATIDLVTMPIMQGIVPRQKLGVFRDLARFELDRLPPDADRHQVRAALGRAWDSVDNRMGQLVYDNLFWHRIAKDMLQASVRSVGWNLGTLRELGGGAIDTLAATGNLARLRRPEFTDRMAYIIAMPLLAGISGAVYQYLKTGQGPTELKDYFFPKTGEKDEKGHDVRMSLPSYMKDVYHYAHAPWRTATGKLHPAIGTIYDMLANKDFFGEKIRNEDDPLVKQIADLATFAAKQAIPLGVRNASDDNLSTSEKLQAFVGVTRAPKYLSMSDAEQKATELRQAQMKDPDQGALDAYKASRPILRDLRSHDEAVQQRGQDALDQAVEKGTIPVRKARDLLRLSQTTTLEHQVHDMSALDAMRVWKVATPEERALIAPEIQAKVARSTSLSGELRAKFLKDLGVE